MCKKLKNFSGSTICWLCPQTAPKMSLSIFIIKTKPSIHFHCMLLKLFINRNCPIRKGVRIINTVSNKQKPITTTHPPPPHQKPKKKRKWATILCCRHILRIKPDLFFFLFKNRITLRGETQYWFTSLNTYAQRQKGRNYNLDLKLGQSLVKT